MLGKTHRIGKGIIDVTKQFSSEAACQAYLEAARWPNGVRCLYCGGDRISKFTAKGRTRTKKDGTTAQSPDRHLYQCLNKGCKHQFTVGDGTIFNDTHLSLSKWFMAAGLMCNAKKGISAKQMEHDLGVSYKTAWYLCHRIRKAMNENGGDLFSGVVEADETYVGGRYDKRRRRAKYDKEPVFGIAERGGKARTWHVPQVNRYHVISKLRDNISIDATTVYTDESPMYKRMPEGLKHDIVNHSEKEWVRGECHTGTIDGFGAC